MVVHPDHGHVVRHRQAEIAGGEDGPDRHLVRRREDGGGALSRVAEQLLRRARLKQQLGLHGEPSLQKLEHMIERQTWQRSPWFVHMARAASRQQTRAGSPTFASTAHKHELQFV